MTQSSRKDGRLAGKNIILTGAGGNIGQYITRQMLAEGANVVMTGRNQYKLDELKAALAEEGYDTDRTAIVTGDCADPEACRRIVSEAVSAFGPIDVLVNNAGTAGPKQTLRDIPFTDADKKARDEGLTMYESAMNLLGGPWNMSRAAVPEMSVGGSIINVSTIFSRTRYYGRIPYVVPKSGLNAFSQGLALELGKSDRAIRVNCVYPGPIKSERIDTVFAAMDSLQDKEPGSTKAEFTGLMIAQRPDADGNLTYDYPTPDDVASTIVWLSSDESAAFSGQSIEITNGMQVPAESRSKLVSWPDNRLVDLTGSAVLILGGADVDEAFAFANANIDRGARIVLGFRDLNSVGVARSRAKAMGSKSIHVQQVDPLRPESVQRVFQYFDDQFGRLDGVVVLPATPNGQHGYTLSTADEDDIEKFVETELVGPIALASALARHVDTRSSERPSPAVTFVTNPDDGRGNLLNEIKRASVEALIRVWRYEERYEIEKGEWGWDNLPNQLVRYDNKDHYNLAFAADWTATLNNRVRKMDPINLWVPKNIQRATGKGAMPKSIQRVLPGLHHGKTAVITGGSLGIGLQVGRYLAMAGARVLLSARSPDKLEAARLEIIEELRGIGYSNPENRVLTMSGVDVGDEAGLHALFQRTIELFGELDFLINNAGIAGAEEMVVDMSLDDWNYTMEANLISNYSLIRKFAPRMKNRGSGAILNVSSYFGGEKYVAVAYPNRADYSVSKAGQRALAEILSRHLGPEIQINATAPGPVDGARLRGLGGAPGLFARRGRLIMENVRLNRVHAAILASLEMPAQEILDQLVVNDLEKLKNWSGAPAPLVKLFAQIGATQAYASAERFLLGPGMAEKLVRRLVGGGVIDQEQADAFVQNCAGTPAPFFDQREIDKSAKKIEAGILNLLHLHRMPTDEEVGLTTVFNLADHCVSGETFHPSGGLKFDRSVTEGEMMLPPGAEDLAALKGKHVVLTGDAMRDELVVIAEGFIRYEVASITVLTRSQEAADEIRNRIDVPEGIEFESRAIGDDLEGGLQSVLAARSRFDIVVNTPFARLPLNALAADAGEDWDRVLSREQFADLVRDHVTHHFRVAKAAAMVPGCQIVLVTPDTTRASTREEFALAMFIKTTMHAFTVTMGVECERLPTVPAVNQVQLTRRARAEEPSNDQEQAEEMERLVGAVLLCSVPAPSPAESRYLARIFRGNAVTV
jgi:malonyl-CoA reductase/3-hydroxypropionate dehydrogenase (NADP+)